ncbi:hypothetical protein [Paraburkholderia sediminicola]|uniref:hypothetical protein n=1 Tax=Paraburkholderia sediminicola TaxID=458836 RepID=UPI0038BA5F5A
MAIPSMGSSTSAVRDDIRSPNKDAGKVQPVESTLAIGSTLSQTSDEAPLIKTALSALSGASSHLSGAGSSAKSNSHSGPKRETSNNKQIRHAAERSSTFDVLMARSKGFVPAGSLAKEKASPSGPNSTLSIATAQGGRAQPTEQTAPPLPNASMEEFKELNNQYDTQDGYLHRSSDANTQNEQKIEAGLQQQMTGYPPEVIRFAQKQTQLQCMIAELPGSERQFYGGAIAILGSAYQLETSSDKRAVLDQKFTELESAVGDEFTRVSNDAVDRALGVFNPPTGEAYLGKEDRQDVDKLGNLRDRFLHAPDAGTRKAIFQEASELKGKLQNNISTKISERQRTEDSDWKEANGEVDRILNEAQAQADPAKRYELIGRQLFELDPGQDKLKDKVILAFTQRMQDSPELRDRLDTWHDQVSGPLNDHGVGAAKKYTDILKHLPPVSGDYVRDLSDQYNAVLKDVSFKDSITPAARAEKLVGQILEGIMRTMLGLTPLAPLADALPSTLPVNVRMGIDYGSALVGMLAGEGGGVAREISFAGKGIARAAGDAEVSGLAGREGGAAGEGLVQGAGKNMIAATQGELALSPEAKAAEKALQEKTVAEAGPAVDPTNLLAHQSVGDKSYGALENYADSSVSLKDLQPGQEPGILVDANGDRYIELGGKAYRARFDQESYSWRVFNKGSELKPQIPVRLNETTQQWEPESTAKPGKSGPNAPSTNGARFDVPDRYASVPDGELVPDPDRQGIFRDNKLQAYIKVNGKTWPVRWDKEQGTWRVYQTNAPSNHQYSVRLDEHGNWQVHSDTGLRGGMDSGSSSGGSPSSAGSAERPFPEAFRVSTSNGAAPSTAMEQTLNPPAWSSVADGRIDDPAFVQQYRTAFNNLPEDQRRAIRDWSYVDDGGSAGYSSDSSSVSYKGFNYDFNKKLFGGAPDAEATAHARTLQTGLDGLPIPGGANRLLRIAHVDRDYASKFSPGEYVTNSPAFMSASSKNEYAQYVLGDKDEGTGPDHPFALYDIQAQSATPFVSSVNTMATEEGEWVFRPGAVFRVEEVAVAKPNDPTENPRIGMRLVEVPVTQPIYAKNIHTGQLQIVYPSGTTLQAPAGSDPNLPPPPAYGNPNEPGAVLVGNVPGPSHS